MHSSLSPDLIRLYLPFYLLYLIHLILLYFETCSCSDTTCPDATRASRQCVSPFTKSFPADRVRLRGFCLVGTHDRTWRHWNYATVDCRCQMRSDTRGVLLPSRCDSLALSWSSFLRNTKMCDKRSPLSNRTSLGILSLIMFSSACVISQRF